MPAALLPTLRTLVPTATIWDAAELASRDPGFDARNFGASALVRPRDVEGVATLVKFCAEHSISLVPQGGRTGLAGGAATSAGQVICDLGGLNQIEEIDPFARVAIVQAGVTLGALQEACAVHGLDPGIDLAARHHRTVQPALEPARQEIADDEDDDAAEDAEEGDGHRTDRDAGRQLVGPGLDVAGLEAPHQQDQRQEHHHDHQVDGDADHQAELVEGGILVA
ncbi:FAD-binding oxidoreductase [Mesorhizobium sp. M2C.T.Ca.TU.009.01.2.1]|nr:FAD-binding oxidoreductase [Mesorhizobium sp. M2C.T.Ca.TU.009.01.2.1]